MKRRALTVIAATAGWACGLLIVLSVPGPEPRRETASLAIARGHAENGYPEVYRFVSSDGTVFTATEAKPVVSSGSPTGPRDSAVSGSTAWR